MRFDRLVLSGALLLFTAHPSPATVDVEAALPLKAEGSLRPEGDEDILRFVAVTGSGLDLSVSASAGLSLTVEIFDRDGFAVDPGDARVVDTGARWSVKGLDLPSSGAYAILLSGSGAGEYRLNAKAKAPAKFSWRGEPLGGGGTASFDLAAFAGSRLTIQAKAVRGSAALPRLAALSGDGFSLDLAEEGIRMGSSHRVVVDATPAGGDLVLEVGNDAAMAGDIDVTVSVRAPRSAGADLDLRAVALGMPGGMETWKTERLSDEGGGVSEEDGASACCGAGVFVPGTGLAGPVRLDLLSAPDLEPPESGWIPAGPAVRVLREGDSPTDALLVLPLDMAAIPANRVPADVRVLAREGNGTVSLLPSGAAAFDGVDRMGARVTALPPDRTLQPTIRRGMPRMPGRFWGLESRLEMITGGGAGLAMDQTADLGVLSLELLADGNASIGVEQRSLAFGYHVDGGAYAVEESGSGSGAGTWVYGGDGRSIVFTPSDKPEPLRFEVSADGSAAASQGFTPGQSSISSLVLLRRAESPPSMDSLAGTWGISCVSYSFRTGGAGGSLGAEVERFQVKMVLRADGTFSFPGSTRSLTFGTVDWSSRSQAFSFGGTASVAGDGSVGLHVVDPGKESFTFRLLPEAGGRFGLLFKEGGARKHVFGTAIRLGAAPVLPGTMEMRLPEFGTAHWAGQDMVQGPDIQLGALPALLTRGTGAAFSGSGSSHSVSRETAVGGSVIVEDGPASFTLGIAMDSRGALVVTDPEGGKFKGWMAEGGAFGSILKDTADPSGTAALGILFPPVDPGD